MNRTETERIRSVSLSVVPSFEGQTLIYLQEVRYPTGRRTYRLSCRQFCPSKECSDHPRFQGEGVVRWELDVPAAKGRALIRMVNNFHRPLSINRYAAVLDGTQCTLRFDVGINDVTYCWTRRVETQSWKPIVG